jgi:hypothetical protein
MSTIFFHEHSLSAMAHLLPLVETNLFRGGNE